MFNKKRREFITLLGGAAASSGRVAVRGMDAATGDAAQQRAIGSDHPRRLSR
jgi:hypothetical protein